MREKIFVCWDCEIEFEISDSETIFVRPNCPQCGNCNIDPKSIFMEELV